MKEAVANRTVAPRASAPRTTSRKTSSPADTADDRLAGLQRAILAGTVVLAAIAVWRPLVDPFMLPKLTVVVLGAVSLVAVAGLRAVRHGRVTIPVGASVWIVAGFGAALLLAAAASDNRLIAVVGDHGRYGGLLSYLAYLLVFLVVVRLFSASSPAGLMRALVVALALVSAYGLAQAAGMDPYTWSSGRDKPVFSTLGNTNFAGAYTAMVLPVAAAAAVFRGWSTAWRLASGVILLLGVCYVPVTGATQGLLAAAAGLALVAVAAVLRRSRSGPGRSTAVVPRWQLAVGGGLGLVLVVLAGIRLAPEIEQSLGERLQFWQAALGMFVDHPVLGTGLDSFRDYFLQYRPGEHAALRAFQGADSAHNVPLGMLANGGVLLAVAYLALVAYTGWTLVRGLRTLPAHRLPVLAAFGGTWVAYQVQSLVSIDVPAVTFLHFVSSALIIATVAPPPVAVLRLPLSPAVRGGMLPRRSSARGPSAAALVLVLVGALVMSWIGTRPLRADAAAGSARGLQGERALPTLDRAVALAPWEAEYRLLQGQARLDAGDVQGAYEAAATASEQRRGSSQLALGTAELAVRVDDLEAARRWLEVALVRDPRNPKAFERGAEVARTLGEDEQAARLEDRAEELRARYGR